MDMDASGESDLQEKIIWANVIGLTLSWIIWNPFQNAVWTYWQVFLYALGATPFIISLISALSGITISIARIPGGYLADKVGRRLLIVSMTYVIAFTYLIMYFANGWEIILIASIISNIALFYQPALNAIIADSLPKTTRGRGFAIINILPSIVTLISPYIAYIYVSKYGILGGTRELLLLSFLSGIAAATVRLFTLKETIKHRGKLDSDIVSEMKFEYKKAIKIVWGRMKFLLISYALTGIAMGLSYLTQFYSLKYLMVSEEKWAYIQIISFATYLVLSLPFSVATDKIGRKPPIIVATIVAFISSVILAIAPIGEEAFLYVLISSTLGSLAWAMVSSALPSIEADLLPLEIRGKGYAVINLINSLVISLAQLLSGAIYTVMGPRMPFYLSSLFWLLSLVMFMKIPETLRR